MSDVVRNIMLVEDSPADWELVTRGMRLMTPQVALIVAGTGEEALRLLSGEPGQLVPDMVLLDLNLPDLHGREVLRHLRSHATLAGLPVVVLTTSDSQKDMLESYRLGCNGYLIKPHSFQEYARLLKETCHYWLDLATFPRIRTSKQGPE